MLPAAYSSCPRAGGTDTEDSGVKGTTADTSTGAQDTSSTTGPDATQTSTSGGGILGALGFAQGGTADSQEATAGQKNTLATTDMPADPFDSAALSANVQDGVPSGGAPADAGADVSAPTGLRADVAPSTALSTQTMHGSVQSGAYGAQSNAAFTQEAQSGLQPLGGGIAATGLGSTSFKGPAADGPQPDAAFEGTGESALPVASGVMPSVDPSTHGMHGSLPALQASGSSSALAPAAGGLQPTGDAPATFQSDTVDVQTGLFKSDTVATGTFGSTSAVETSEGHYGSAALGAGGAAAAAAVGGGLAYGLSGRADEPGMAQPTGDVHVTRVEDSGVLPTVDATTGDEATGGVLATGGVDPSFGAAPGAATGGDSYGGSSAAGLAHGTTISSHFQSASHSGHYRSESYTTESAHRTSYSTTTQGAAQAADASHYHDTTTQDAGQHSAGLDAPVGGMGGFQQPLVPRAEVTTGDESAQTGAIGSTQYGSSSLQAGGASFRGGTATDVATGGTADPDALTSGVGAGGFTSSHYQSDSQAAGSAHATSYSTTTQGADASRVQDTTAADTTRPSTGLDVPIGGAGGFQQPVGYAAATATPSAGAFLLPQGALLHTRAAQIRHDADSCKGAEGSGTSFAAASSNADAAKSKKEKKGFLERVKDKVTGGGSSTEATHTEERTSDTAGNTGAVETSGAGRYESAAYGAGGAAAATATAYGLSGRSDEPGMAQPTGDVHVMRVEDSGVLPTADVTTGQMATGGVLATGGVEPISGDAPGVATSGDPYQGTSAAGLTRPTATSSHFQSASHSSHYQSGSYAAESAHATSYSTTTQGADASRVQDTTHDTARPSAGLDLPVGGAGGFQQPMVPHAATTTGAGSAQSGAAGSTQYGSSSLQAGGASFKESGTQDVTQGGALDNSSTGLQTTSATQGAQYGVGGYQAGSASFKDSTTAGVAEGGALEASAGGLQPTGATPGVQIGSSGYQVGAESFKDGNAPGVLSCAAQQDHMPAH